MVVMLATIALQNRAQTATNLFTPVRIHVFGASWLHSVLWWMWAAFGMGALLGLLLGVLIGYQVGKPDGGASGARAGR
jgi:hypothetical protein